MKHTVGVQVEKNAFVDDGDGNIRFPNGLIITDDSEQKNGTRYDIDSMDLSNYKGQITADHMDMLNAIIGKAIGVAKRGKQVVVEGIKFALKENAAARLAYDLLRGGYLSDFSIETYGPPPDEDGVYYNAKLVGLSAVVVGNNDNATINQVVRNSIEQAKQDGLDTTEVESLITTNEETDVTKVRVKNTRDFAITLKIKNDQGEDEDIVLKPGESVDVPEDDAEGVEGQIDGAEAPKKADEPENGGVTLEALKGIISEAVQPISEKVKQMEQNAFDKGAQEPGFEKKGNAAPVIKDELSGMDYRERHGLQVQHAWNALKSKSQDAFAKLQRINEYHLETLKKDGIVKNTMTIADFGNFVISRELLSDIEGCRNGYSDFVNAHNFRETLSQQFAWLKRSDDIDMQPVEFCDDDADGNLKPISEYTAEIQTSDLEELAAVTPVCNAATRFLAADLLGDVAAGYRNDYQRKLAQLIVARLEQAVEATGNSEVYNTDSDVNAIKEYMNIWAAIADCEPNGTFIMSTKSYAELVQRALAAGVNGPLAQLFTTGAQNTIFGRPYILVPSDLLPTLNTAETKSFTVNGDTVTVNHAVFYYNPTNFTGRVSGGLQYDLSTEAAYEVDSTVRSAYQRNELVLRGSFFRGGAILNEENVVGLNSAGVS